MKSDISLNIEQNRKQPSSLSSSFHESISFVLIFGQFFGIMPLDGVTTGKISALKFNWKSLRFFYAMYNIVGALVMAILCISKFAIDGLMLDKTGTMSFYVLNTFATIQFLYISRNWGKIVKEYTFVEISMRNSAHARSFINLKRKFLVLTVIIMGLAFVEHLLFVINALVFSSFCKNYHHYPSEIYFGNAFPSVFTQIPYDHWKAVLVEISNVLSTVTWNFTDLFIILISYSLAVRFRQIAKRMEYNNSKVMHEQFWCEIREDYTKASNLTNLVDEYLSPLVAISFVSNIFFICVQLYNSLKKRISVAETVYYFYSFGFLVARTIAVTIYGAWINDESRKPLLLLHSIPSEHYCSEVNRFIQQINSGTIGISGSRFFYVTRSFLLKMASTIITFELVFLQFGPLVRYEQYQFNSTYECIK